MSKGINKVILIGNLGVDPENVGVATKIKLATSESFKDKSGQTTERTEWHTVTFFGRLAEIAQQYLKKGAKVYIEGSIRTNKYTGKDNIERYSTEIIANNLQMLSGKSHESADDNGMQKLRNNGIQPAVNWAPTAPVAQSFDDDDSLPF